MSNVVLATAGYDHTIRFWEAASGTCNRTVKYPDSQVNCLQITPDRKYIAAAGNPNIRLFEINSNNPNHVTSYDGHVGNVTGVGFQRHGKWMYSCSDDGTVKIWDLRAPSAQRSFDCGGAPINSIALHPNQAELIIGDQNGNIHVHDLTSSVTSPKFSPPGAESAIRCVDIVKDASAMVASNNLGQVFFYAPNGPDRYELRKTLQAHDAYILKSKVSYDGRMLATCSSDSTAKVWNIAGIMEEEMPGEDDETDSGGRSDEGDKSMTVDPSRLLHTLQGHQRWVWDCAFSAVSSYLVTCSSDQSARLWDVSQGETVRHYTGHHKAVICVALNDNVEE